MLGFILRILKSVYSFFFESKYHLDDLLHILRPFVYVFSVLKHGQQSYKPIKISFMMDLVASLVSLLRLVKASQNVKGSRLRESEKREIMRRIWSNMVKYLVRDPIFENFTKAILVKVFSTLRVSPKLYNIFFALIAYFRYYTYIS